MGKLSIIKIYIIFYYLVLKKITFSILQHFHTCIFAIIEMTCRDLEWKKERLSIIEIFKTNQSPYMGKIQKSPMRLIPRTIKI
jgi:hypothetical protein